MAEQHLRCCLEGHLVQKDVSCGSRTTLYSAAVASPETVSLARMCGLVISSMPLNDNVVEAVALSGRCDVLQHLVREWLCQTPSIANALAARSGSISMLQWLKAHSWWPFDELTCGRAAFGGQLAALEYLRAEGCAWNKELIAYYAAAGGSIEIVEWLRQQQGVLIDSGTLKMATHAGHTAMCAHLRSIGCEWDDDTCTKAAEGGHLETLRWLRETGCPWDTWQICKHAANNGSIDILDYVTEQGEVLDAELLTKALNNACASGQLQAAQWLRQRGAEWPAVLGYDEEEQWSGAMIAWARAEGCTSLEATVY
eukprot:4491-Heterococcus_DN1.PRE.2